MNNSPAELAAVAQAQFGITATPEAIAGFAQWASDNLKHSSLRTAPPKLYKRQVGERNPPHLLLDSIMEKCKLRNDAALCRFLDIAPPVVSKIRSGRLGFSAAMVLRVHEKLGTPIDDIKALLAPTVEVATS